MQKGQTNTVGYRIYSVGMWYAVGAIKINSHSLLSKYGWWGLLPLVQKRSYPTQLGMQYAVDVGVKRSSHTVYLANMGGGDHYL